MEPKIPVSTQGTKRIGLFVIWLGSTDDHVVAITPVTRRIPAAKLSSVLSYQFATARNSLIFAMKFSIWCRHRAFPGHTPGAPSGSASMGSPPPPHAGSDPP